MNNTTLAKTAHDLAIKELNRQMFWSRIGSLFSSKVKASHLDKIILKAKLEERVLSLGKGARMTVKDRAGES